MGGYLQYEDDFDDTNLFMGNKKKKRDYSSSDEESGKQKKGAPKILQNKDK
jgi:hypothetical protein